ncbi:ABC transporter G family member 11-like [Dendrobium catenatum]|uniref:ABC transporter G family member 11-like n=1 Tax=Dendrobium catenatum TaxID=906689 RepID=UPI0009F6826F|nr:ABC transporter G family member 11-like [Dendrobium catenatum]
MFSYDVITPSPSPAMDGESPAGEQGPPNAAGGLAVFLTWEDLCVRPLDGKGSESVPILSKVTGMARPGEVLAIMGPSGCGKSTLLDALAGRLASNLRCSGELLVNGRTQILAFGVASYVMQEDILMATLTVREAVHYAAELQLSETMGREDRIKRAEETLQEMGLSRIAGRRIGGRSSKGISGGQRRRLSICLEILARPKVLFLDEPSSGLDSAAAFHVMDRIGRMAAREQITVLAAVHQPSAEVFGLFRSVCLLAYGRTVFFGSPGLAKQFFATNGFPCPSLQNPSDHFLRTINKDFENDNEEDIEGGQSTTSKAIEILVDSYSSSICMLQLLSNIAIIHKMAKSSMLGFITSFLTFMAIGGFPSFAEDMKIFRRERLNGHYGVTTFVIANTISSIPYLAFISIVPGAIAYYLAGLRGNISHFAYFSLILLTCMMLVEGLMMIVAATVPNFLMGIIIGAGIQGVMMLNGGFFRLPSELPMVLWRYPLYYISFHKYAVQGFYKNEFMGQSFIESQTIEKLPTLINGNDILNKMFQVEMGYSKWVDLVILLGMLVLYRVSLIVILKASEKVRVVTCREMMAGDFKHVC